MIWQERLAGWRWRGHGHSCLRTPPCWCGERLDHIEKVKPTLHIDWPIVSQYAKIGLLQRPGELWLWPASWWRVHALHSTLRWPMVSTHVPNTGRHLYRLVEGHEWMNEAPQYKYFDGAPYKNYIIIIFCFWVIQTENFLISRPIIT